MKNIPVQPDTTIILLKNPLSMDNKNQLTFASKEEQFNYFFNLPKIIEDNFSYQRKDGSIRFPAHIDNLIEFNYVMYKNVNYSDKWFYCFITGMNYENDEVTTIYIQTDVFQTWQFDLNWKESFIEREHIDVNLDIPGANLYPESLETGEVKEISTAEFDELEPCYIVAYTGDRLIENINQNGASYNGIWSSVCFLVCNVLSNVLELINNSGQGDKILTVFSIPKLAVKDFLISNNMWNKSDTNYSLFKPINQDFMQAPLFKTLVETPSTIDGYTPKNQKLRTYPYLYLGFNPQNGSEKIYRYENFNGAPKFKIISEINPNPSVYFIPQNYNIIDNLNEACSLNGYPNISYKNDYYNTWLAQNSQMISLDMRQEHINYLSNQVLSGINGTTSSTFSASGGDTQGVLSGIIGAFNTGAQLAINQANHDLNIQKQLAQIQQQKLLPDKANLGSSNATLLGYNMIDKAIFTRFSIKRQFAERIDKYWDMYGYLTNTVKLPNINNRPNWNYIKTIGANILADIPQDDLLSLKNLFDNGITLWHNPITFLDYSQNNR